MCLIAISKYLVSDPRTGAIKKQKSFKFATTSKWLILLHVMIVSNEYHLFESLSEMLAHDVLRRKNMVNAYLFFALFVHNEANKSWGVWGFFSLFS